MYGLAFVMGLVGSLHCVVMCGPLVELFSGKNQSNWLLKRLLYHLGRLAMYAFLGMLIGFFGEIIGLFVSQRYITIFIGIILIISVLLPTFGQNWAIYSYINRQTQPLRKWIIQHQQAHPLLSQIGFGLLNGLLPCGLVYAALASATQLTFTWESGLYMVFFGLGTIPLLVGGSYFWQRIRQFIQIYIPKILPFTYALVGVWMIWRGLEVEIKIDTSGKSQAITVCHAPRGD